MCGLLVHPPSKLNIENIDWKERENLLCLKTLSIIIHYLGYETSSFTCPSTLI